MKLILGAAISVSLLGFASAALADCGIAAGSVRILSNDFDALKVVADGAKECATDTVTVTANLTSTAQEPPGSRADRQPGRYTVALCRQQFDRAAAQRRSGPSARRSDRQVRPGPAAQPADQDRRQDRRHRLRGQFAAPVLSARTSSKRPASSRRRSYEDVLAAAKAIKDKGLLEYPLAAADKPGWDLGAEFVNLYLGTGARLLRARFGQARHQQRKRPQDP